MHSHSVFLIAAARFIERLAYYGVRGTLFMYMLGPQLNLVNGEAISIYTYFSTLTILTPVIGGVLADLALGIRKTLWIGGFTEAAGFMLIAAGNTPCLFAGLALVAIGTGMTTPAGLAAIGHLYHRSNWSQANIGMMIMYIAINAGALIAQIYMLIFQDAHQAAFLVAGGVIAVSQLLLIVPSIPGVPDRTFLHTADSPPGYKTEYLVPVIAALCLCLPLFWYCYEQISTSQMENLRSIENILPQKFAWLVSPALTLLLAGILIIVFIFLRISALLKIFLGFALLSATALLSAVSGLLNGNHAILGAFVCITGLQALAELLAAAIASSFVMHTAPFRFKTLIISGFLVASGFLTRLPSILMKHNIDFNGWLLGGAMLLSTLIFMVFWLVWRKQKIYAT